MNTKVQKLLPSCKETEKSSTATWRCEDLVLYEIIMMHFLFQLLPGLCVKSPCSPQSVSSSVYVFFSFLFFPRPLSLDDFQKSGLFFVCLPELQLLSTCLRQCCNQQLWQSLMKVVRFFKSTQKDATLNVWIWINTTCNWIKDYLNCICMYMCFQYPTRISIRLHIWSHAVTLTFDGFEKKVSLS